MNKDGNGPPKRILIIAEAANPEWTSVPLVGWFIYRALSRVANVHLVTHVRNKAAIERQGLVEGRDFTAIDNESVAAPVYKLASLLRGGDGKGWTTLTAITAFSYYSFESILWSKFKDRFKAGEFDLVHRVTPLSPTSQSTITKKLWKLKIPFLVGPLNGGLPWPKGFSHRQVAEREWLAYVRGLYKLMPAYGSMRKYSAAFIVGSRFTLSDLPTAAQSRAFYIPENGISQDEVTPLSHRAPSIPLRAAFVGRLVQYKGADILLDAAAEFLEAGLLRLDIIGDGPERFALEAIVAKLENVDAVQFHGAVPHADVLAKLRQLDIMFLPSVREFGGGVVIEAMALGAVPVVADYGGPAELVDDETGIKVAFHDKDSLSRNLKLAIENLINNPQKLASYREAALRKVIEQYTWEAKAGQILDVYNSVLGSRERSLVR